MLHGGSPQSVRVVGATSGSLILEIGAAFAVVGTIATAAHWTLEALTKYRDFQLKSAEVLVLSKKYPENSDEFERSAKEWDDRAEQVIGEVSASVEAKVNESIDGFQTSQAIEGVPELWLTKRLTDSLGSFNTAYGQAKLLASEQVEELIIECIPEVRDYLHETAYHSRQ